MIPLALPPVALSILLSKIAPATFSMGKKLFYRFIVGQLGMRAIKSWIDEHFRHKVQPIPGSVLYADLGGLVEHSGIHYGSGRIINIGVTGFVQGTVLEVSPDDFVGKSVRPKQIYVSSDENGAVGGPSVANEAYQHLGDEYFYGLVINNCHDFSRKCVETAPAQISLGSFFSRPIECSKGILLGSTERSFGELKIAARKRLGATKWLLWNLSGEGPDAPEPDWNDSAELWRNMPFGEDVRNALELERIELEEYLKEIADEAIPEEVVEKVRGYLVTVTEIAEAYDKYRSFFIKGLSCLTFNELRQVGEDFTVLSEQLRHNQNIKDLICQLGRSDSDEERKEKYKIGVRNQFEVYGIHRHSNLSHILPSELVNLEDSNTEYLFYARLLENNLMSYRLEGVSEEERERWVKSSQKGPVVACIDTSASMSGRPMQKARALALATAQIVLKEKRKLHLILFGGSSSEIVEYTCGQRDDLEGMICFLKNGYNSGTCFDAPLERSFQFIAQEKEFRTADILLITDGDCSVSSNYQITLMRKIKEYNTRIFMVLCNGIRPVCGPMTETVVI